jgi:hypothetical protein
MGGSRAFCNGNIRNSNFSNCTVSAPFLIVDLIDNRNLKTIWEKVQYPPLFSVLHVADRMLMDSPRIARPRWQSQVADTES